MEMRWLICHMVACLCCALGAQQVSAYLPRQRNGSPAPGSARAFRPPRRISPSYRSPQEDTRDFVTHSSPNSNGGIETEPDEMAERKRKIMFLRTSTGKGTQECYEALSKADGDVRAALDLIRQGGDNCGASSAGGSTAEVIDLLHGRVTSVTCGNVAALLELRCETDFVARNNVFMALAKSFANAALAVALRTERLDALTSESLGDQMLEQRCLRCNKTPTETALISKQALHERLIVTRVGIVRAGPEEFLTGYLHGPIVWEYPLNQVGSAASLLKFTLGGGGGEATPADFQAPLERAEPALEGNCCMAGSECVYASGTMSLPSAIEESDQGLRRNVKQFAKHVVQHIVGARPAALALEDFDPQRVAAAREELEREAVESGKPKETVERIVAGRLRKQFGEFVLMEQKWPFDGGKPSVASAIQDFDKKNKVQFTITQMMQFSVVDDLLTFRPPAGAHYYAINRTF